jgi:integrase
VKRRERRRKEVELRFDRYVELFTKEYLKRRWKDWARIHSMLVYYAVPVVGTKRLSDIKRADLTAIYRRLDNLPSVARAMHATLRKMFNWAMSRDDLKHSPVNGVEAPPTLRARNRHLTNDELRCAWETSFQLPGQYGPALRLMMLTGQRRGEVTGLDWSELNRAQRSWILPAERAKNGNLHVVPLSKQTIAVLDAAAGGSNWPSIALVFPSTCGTRLSGFSKIKREWDNKIVAAMLSTGKGAALTPWRLHDLRRTVATGMQALKIRTEIIEAILNHLSGVKSGIARVYQCYDYQEEKRQAMKAWGRHIKKLTTA